MFYFLLKLFLAPVVKELWVKEIKGLENFPATGPVVVAANHTSYLDFFILAALLPRRVYFLAGEVFFKKWWWYPLVKLTGQIKVERYGGGDKSAVVNTAVEILKQGKILGIFPEGTRSATGEIGSTFTGVARIALAAQCSVVPVGINGAFTVWPRQKNQPNFKKAIIIKIGQPINLSQYYSVVASPEVLRKITDEIVMGEIKKLLKY
ncbi:MAG: lysophospholipid acyltransferase family protein [Candidatus Buchananbacteria bacterium]